MYFTNYDDRPYLLLIENAENICPIKQDNGDFFIKVYFSGDECSHVVELIDSATINDILGGRTVPYKVIVEMLSRSMYEAKDKDDLIGITKKRFEKYWEKE